MGSGSALIHSCMICAYACCRPPYFCMFTLSSAASIHINPAQGSELTIESLTALGALFVLLISLEPSCDHSVWSTLLLLGANGELGHRVESYIEQAWNMLKHVENVGPWWAMMGHVHPCSIFRRHPFCVVKCNRIVMVLDRDDVPSKLISFSMSVLGHLWDLPNCDMFFVI